MRRRAIARTAAVVLVAVASIAREGRAQGTDSTAAAEDPHAAQPERPTVATHAGTVAPGWVEIEAGEERVQLELLGSFQHLSG